MAPRSLRVMVLSADSDEGRRLTTLLANAGYLAQAASQPRRAAEVDQSWPLDALVVVEAPGAAPGSDFIHSLRRRNTTLRGLVIAADKTRADLLAATSDGSIRFLSRPFNDEEFVHQAHSLTLSTSRDERRDQMRYLSSIEAACWVINPFDDSRSRPIPCMTRDVSRSGLSMLSHQLVPVPTMVKIEMRIPGSPRVVTPLAKSLACAMTPIPDIYRIGLKFIGLLPAEVEDALSKLAPDATTAIMPGAGHSYMDALESWLFKNAKEVSLAEESGAIAQQAVDRILSDLGEDPALNAR